jgi:uncharacterized protein YcbK (DUF882 family)
MRSHPLLLSTVALCILLSPGRALSGDTRPSDRFFISGDGKIRIENLKTGDTAEVRYREPRGTYPEAARKRIDRLFGISPGAPDHISLRFVSLLDYVEDRYHLPIRVNSGYRSPEYNALLRAKGRLAAKASLHMEGMAADIVLGRTLAARAFQDIRALACCGVGYYHGESLHLDIGPSRSWDETSSKVDTDISAHNKLLMARTDRDIYLPGERIELRIARITDYPIGISASLQVERSGIQLARAPAIGAAGDCLTIAKPAQREILLRVPGGLPTGTRLQLRVGLCNRPFAEMPNTILSNDILVWAVPGAGPRA